MTDGTQTSLRVPVKNCSCMGEHKEHVIRDGDLIKYEDGTYGRE